MKSWQPRESWKFPKQQNLTEASQKLLKKMELFPAGGARFKDMCGSIMSLTAFCQKEFLSTTLHWIPGNSVAMRCYALDPKVFGFKTRGQRDWVLDMVRGSILNQNF